MIPNIDFHAHILPGMDHGCPDETHSLHQLQAAKQAGVTHIVATSHFYSAKDDLAHFLEKRERALKRLQEVNDTGIVVIPGAEVQISGKLPQMEGYEQLCIGESTTMLLEMPWNSWTNGTFDAIMKTENSKCRPVIAHIDRYPESDWPRVLELGIPLQVNASSLISMWKRGKLLKLVKDGRIRCLGSDVHLEYQKDYANFAKAEKVLKHDLTEMMRWTAKRLNIPEE